MGGGVWHFENENQNQNQFVSREKERIENGSHYRNPLSPPVILIENDSHYHSIEQATILRMVLIIVIPYPLSY